MFGNLYSDERIESVLDAEAQAQFNHYQTQLLALSTLAQARDVGDRNTSPWQAWENGLRQIYKDMIFDAFNVFSWPIPANMEVHFAGSLAKAQATEYSDLDVFVLVEKDEEIDKIKTIFDALNNLCQRLFTATNKLCPDPIGINPSHLIGTPDSLCAKLRHGEVGDLEPAVLSILASKPVFPRYKLGEDLRNQINADPLLKQYCSAKKLYNKAIQDFKAPPQLNESISIKTHIMRPLDFVLMGLRKEFNLYQEDGAHLSVPGTITLLRERRLLPEADIRRIDSLYTQAMNKRFRLHAQHQKEHDDMPYTEAEELLTETAWLRELAARRIQKLEARPNSFFSVNLTTLALVSTVLVGTVAAIAGISQMRKNGR